MPKKIDLSNLSGGAVAERIGIEINKVLSNIADPNTDAAKARKLTIEMSFKADEERDVVRTSIKTKLSLVHPREIETKLILDLDNDGHVVGAELKSGVKNQLMITDEGVVGDHTGAALQNEASKVVGFNRHHQQ